MIAVLPPSASAWTDEQRAMYYAQMAAYQKDEVVGVLLALFLGTFGAHHFYMRQTALGVLYCVFFWTGIPTVVSFISASLCRDGSGSTTWGWRRILPRTWVGFRRGRR